MIRGTSRIRLDQLGWSTQLHWTWLTEFCVSAMWPCVDTSTCSPLPSSGYRGRPLREPCGFPPSQVLWARKTARLPVAVASGLPWQQVSARRGLVRFPWGFPSSPGTWSCWGWARPTPKMRQRQGALLAVPSHDALQFRGIRPSFMALWAHRGYMNNPHVEFSLPRACSRRKGCFFCLESAEAT